MTDRKKREFKTADYEIFERALKQLAMTGPDLCEELGYHRSAMNKWKEVGKIPYVVSLAIECLFRRNGAARRALIRSEKFEILEGELHCQKVMDGIWLVK